MKKIAILLLQVILLSISITGFSQVIKGTYAIKNVLSGKTFQAINQPPSAGDVLNEQPIGNTIIQQYEFIPVSKNVFLIKVKDTELYLTPSDNKGTINAPVILSKKTGIKLQQWTIYEQHPTI